jgi:hypothetical protein
MTITQYRPAFFEGFENEVVEFSTTEELLAIPFLQGFKHEGFTSWARSGKYLMAIYRNGREWWVAGILSDPCKVDLPVWDGGIYEVINHRRKTRSDPLFIDLPGTDVSWSTGNDVCDKQGTIWKKRQLP